MSGIPIILPVIFGLFMLLKRFKKRSTVVCYTLIVSVINTVFSFIALFTMRRVDVLALSFSESFFISFNIDGAGFLFGIIVSVLWIPATLYAMEYMKHEGHENTFFSFFTISYGVTLGIAFAGNLLTMYLFFELLTLVTLPLVMHGLKPKNLAAGQRYLTFSITGAAMGFVTIMILFTQAGRLDFSYGGYFTGAAGESIILVGYIIAFFGFGVKAAVFPFYIWLPSAGVAPTPVTALLHAVAVVNAGVFAVIRVTYYCFGPDIIGGSFAQYIATTFAIITIVFGSAMALRSKHLKQRLAYSTISNLSYMLFAITLMCPEGLYGAMLQMVSHSVLKITLFFVAGAILYKTGKEYVYQLNGIGKQMPVMLSCFTICSAALMGIPPLSGFSAKYLIGMAAVSSGEILAYIGVFALIISTLLTALYLLSVIIPAFALDGMDTDQKRAEPNLLMRGPVVFLTALSVILALFAEPLLNIIKNIAFGGLL